MKRNMLFSAALWALALVLSTSARQPGDRSVGGADTSEVAINLSLGLGGTRYEENVDLTGAQSDWSAAMLRLGGVVSIDTGTWLYQIHGSYFISDKDTEEWTEGGAVVQKNSMDISGIAMLGEVGFPLSRGEPTTLTPFIGLGSRFITYDRNDFQIFRPTARIENADVGSVGENVDLFYLNAALEFDHELGQSDQVASRLDLGYVFFNEVDNDLLGNSLEGDGGFIVRGELSWVREFDVLNHWGVGVFVDFQDLNGASTSGRGRTSSGLIIPFDVEWPDNTLFTYGASLFWKHDL